MKLLLDTHLLLWLASAPEKLSTRARSLIENETNRLVFSVVSIWEIGIKHQLAKLDPRLRPLELRQILLRNDYEELAINGPHALSVGALPLIHKDPFDRMLVAQAAVEGALLLTSDRKVARYPGMIQLV